MKNINRIIVFALIFALISCKKNEEKPKVSYAKKTKLTVKQVDTATISVIDLPIQFEGTSYLIFPVGSLNVVSNGNSKYDSFGSTDDSQSFSISNNMDNEITGNLENLKFQKIDSQDFTTLSNKPIYLESITYLKTFANKTKLQLLVHLLADNDSNDDGKLDSNDIKSLYLSDISGAKFSKISVDLQEIINWKLIESQNRLYFKTIEDTNKNGKFDKADKLHYAYVNLMDKDWKVVEIVF